MITSILTSKFPKALATHFQMVLASHRIASATTNIGGLHVERWACSLNAPALDVQSKVWPCKLQSMRVMNTSMQMQSSSIHAKHGETACANTRATITFLERSPCSEDLEVQGRVCEQTALAAHKMMNSQSEMQMRASIEMYPSENTNKKNATSQ